MAVLEGARLQIVFDGQTTVDTPIGEFFGSGLGKYDVRTLMFSVDNSSPNGWYTTWGPMLFAQRAVVQIVNNSGVPIQGGAIEVTNAPNTAVAAPLSPHWALGYLHWTVNQNEEVDRRGY